MSDAQQQSHPTRRTLIICAITVIICLLLSGGTAVLVSMWFGPNIALASDTSGPAGPDGATGATGADGKSGSTGATGSVGPAGTPGVNGTAGRTGATGATGSSGATGQAGASGQAGQNGAAGAQGIPGPQGVSGVSRGFIPTLLLASDASETYSATDDGAIHLQGVWTIPAGTWYVDGILNPKAATAIPTTNIACQFVAVTGDDGTTGVGSDAGNLVQSTLSQPTYFGGENFWDLERPQVSVANFVTVAAGQQVGLACQRLDPFGVVLSWGLEKSNVNAIQLDSVG